MPAVSALSSTQLNTVRSGGMASEIRIAPCLNNIVFRATVNQMISSSVFVSFAWDGLISGVYADVKPGMTFFVTATSDSAELRHPIFRGRVTQTPTATLFYCNEASFNLVDGYIVTVIDSREILQKDRSGALVDGFQSYANLPPAVKNLNSFYYIESNGAGSLSLASTGQAMASGATISSYAWVIPGATYTSGSSSTQNVTVSVPYGRIWASLTITDSNAVANRFDFEILVCTRNDETYMRMAHGDVQFNVDIETGLNASVTYFDGVENLLNRTRVAVIAFDAYKSGSGTFSNVAFVGYLINEETSVAADLVSSTLSETRFEIQSFAAIAAQLPVPSLAVRHAISPNAWDEIKEPTTQRVIWHLISRYSTLGNLCAVNFVTTDSTYYGGNMDMEASTLLESINQLAEEINAKLVFFPEGDATLEINANFLSTTDRNALPYLITSGDITPADLIDYSLPLPYYDTVGQVIAGFASFQTSGSATIKLEGIAPAVARQEGNESPVIGAQLLSANLSASAAMTAAKQRIGDLLEYLNPPELINLTFHDGWRFLTLSTRVWVTFDLPATDSTRGMAIPNTDRYLLQSLSKTWRSDGTWDISGSARLETQGGVAQINVCISPAVIETDLPVLPVGGDYDAFQPDGTLNYLSADPDLQPYDDLSQFQPMTTENAANVANNQKQPNCTLITPPVNMASSQDRATNSSTIPGESYIVSVKGSGLIASGGWQYTFNFLLIDGLPDFTVDVGAWTAGVGYDHTDIVIGGPAAIRSVQLVLSSPPAGVYTGITFTYNLTKGSFTIVRPAVIVFVNGSVAASIASDVATDGTNLTFGWSGSETNPTSLGVQVLSSIDESAPYDSFSGSCRIMSVTFSGTGTNPFTGAPGGVIRGDAFYRIAADGTVALYDSTRGLRLDGAAISPPPYNPNNEYTFEAIGTGAVFVFAFDDTNYADNSGAFIVRVCGSGMT